MSVLNDTGLFQEILNASFTEPLIISAHVEYLNAMVPIIKSSPDAVGSVVDKMFALLTSLPPASKRARLYICLSLTRLAKAADKSFTPHLKVSAFIPQKVITRKMLSIRPFVSIYIFVQGLADKMTSLQRKGAFLPGEHSSLVEAFFAMTSASGYTICSSLSSS